MPRAPVKKRSALIVGGGPVGLGVAALLLSNQQAERWTVRLIEPRPAPDWSEADVDLRVYALSRASQHVLDSAGAWPGIAARRVSPYRRMHVWEGGYRASVGALTFDSAQLGEPDLGHIVEDRLIRHCLIELLCAKSNVELEFGTELAGVRPTADGVEVTTQDGRALTADVLLAADGGASTVRDLLELPVITVPYGQEAIVAHVGTEQPHAETAWLRFLRTGPIALLPLADGRSSIVWSMSTDRAQTLLQLDDDAFMAEVAAATDHALGGITSVSARASFPLRAIHARQYCARRVALIGDAAHAVHPLAGQGMNLGLLDAAVLVEVLQDAVCRGEDPGDLRVLRRYERRQKGRNLKTMLAMDVLHRLFTRAGPLLAPARVCGLTLVDSLPFAKHAFMREALGLVGELPQSARRRVV
ncbi:MAG: UbiH/UbiF/VisC/COQ6 family ubiquinone biosynthesis hydroxylase [Gammaproteobacteria bacterium]|nr:UbiH/UbiF/VisC/COQ6 family ubiquinone biosynthesis hydroxylase [Gammaproteobacteria bacterium]